MKRCSKCGDSKSLDGYYHYSTQRQGKLRHAVTALCKECYRLKAQEQRKHNGDVIRAKARIYYHTVRKAKYYQLRQQVVDAYGGRCTCCGEDRLVFLTIDHFNNDGAADRRRNPEVKGMDARFMRWLIEHSFPTSYQVLCANCNWAKYVLGKCHHVQDSLTDAEIRAEDMLNFRAERVVDSYIQQGI